MCVCVGCLTGFTAFSLSEGGGGGGGGGVGWGGGGVDRFYGAPILPLPSVAVYTIKLAVRFAQRSPSSSICHQGQQLNSMKRLWKSKDVDPMWTRRIQRVGTSGDPWAVNNTSGHWS